MRLPAGWHFRGFLPHFDDGISIQSVTYRLRDSLPSDVLLRLKEAADKDESRLQLESYLDSGHGSCVLRFDRNARIVIENWRHLEGTHYHLHAWVVMPNHVHILVEPTGSRSLASIVRSWKSYTAKQITAADSDNRRLWQPDYWDRFIRNQRHYVATVEYIRQNPVQAGLCSRAEDWPWSSARYLRSRESPRTLSEAMTLGGAGGPPVNLIPERASGARPHIIRTIDPGSVGGPPAAINP